jgi:hypothetical protein
MKKLYILPILAFLIIFLSENSVADSKVDLSLSKNMLIIQSGYSDAIDVTITNKQSITDIFTISILAPPDFKGSISKLKDNLLIHPNSHETTKIIFTIPNCTTSSLVQFTISATSVNDKSVSVSQNFNLQIQGYITCLSSVNLEKDELNPSETVVINSEVRNLVSYAITNNFLDVIISKNGKEVFKESNQLFIPAKSSKIYSTNYTFDKYAEDGIYDINVFLKGEDGSIIDSKSTNVKVNGIKNIVSFVNEENYLLVKKFTITFKNEGNVLSEAKVYENSIPSYLDLFFSSQTPILDKSSYDGKVIYSWQIPPLKPGEYFVIRYGISFINIWTVGIVLAIVLFVIYINFYSVTVRKSYNLKGALEKGKEISVSLEISNKGYGEVKEMVIKDKIPSIVALQESFETMKPIVRKLTDGLELTWRISSMKPHEVRILTYKIKPVMDIIGTLNLPKAKVTFEGRRGRKIVRYSNSVVVK